jgi:REP element-mobilizing transposase RayT
MANPRAYFITFTCYGSHLHGDESGSVDRYHNVYGARRVEPDPARFDATKKLMDHASYVLDTRGRQIVLQAIQEVCTHRAWKLIAAHVRTTHVHVVVEADAAPELVMYDFKFYATRRLNQRQEPRSKHWTRHGSTRYLWKDDDVVGAVDYVIMRQGEPMAVLPVVDSRSAAKTAP